MGGLDVGSAWVTVRCLLLLRDMGRTPASPGGVSGTCPCEDVASTGVGSRVR